MVFKSPNLFFIILTMWMCWRNYTLAVCENFVLYFNILILEDFVIKDQSVAALVINHNHVEY